MNSLNQNKLIGCKIFGHIFNEPPNDIDRLYEIILIPEHMPQGIVIDLKRREEKKIAVEVPEEIRNCNFEKTCIYLLENNLYLIVREKGFEKLRNRKLVLEKQNDAAQLRVSVISFIQGRENGIEYEIELNPYDIGLSFGEVRDPKTDEGKKVALNFDDIKNLKASDLKLFFPKLKPNNFQIEVSGDNLKIQLNDALKQFAESLGKPTKYQHIIENKKAVGYHFLTDEISIKPEKNDILPKPEKGKEETYSNLRLAGPDPQPNFLGKIWKMFWKKK